MWPERNAYAGDQKPASWPDGKRLAVYVAVGIEDYMVDFGLTENISAGVPTPDLVNLSWRDYEPRGWGRDYWIGWTSLAFLSQFF